jgi:hypothetical protein
MQPAQNDLDAWIVGVGPADLVMIIEPLELYLLRVFASQEHEADPVVAPR